MSPTSGRLALKQSNGWFAAGVEMKQALALLSDGAFKLYVYVCLHADRSTGQLPFLQAELAHSLKKSERSIAAYLEELRRQQICCVQPAPNQHQRGRIEVCDSFWPYRKPCASQLSDPSMRAYVDRVRHLFRKPACVQATFSAADEKLAQQWCRRGVSLEQVERAILLGCVRKYVAWINREGSTPITSLHYFTWVLEEVLATSVSPEYWRYLAGKVGQMEKQWRAPANFASAAPAPEGETK